MSSQVLASLRERRKERAVLREMERHLSGSMEGLARLRSLAEDLPNKRPDLDMVFQNIRTDYRNETQLAWFLVRSGWKLNGKYKQALLRRLFLPQTRTGKTSDAPVEVRPRFQSAATETLHLRRTGGVPGLGNQSEAARTVKLNPGSFFLFTLPPETGTGDFRRLVRALSCRGNAAFLFLLERPEDLDRAAKETSFLGFQGIPFGYYLPFDRGSHPAALSSAWADRVTTAGAMFYFLGLPTVELLRDEPSLDEGLASLAAKYPLMISEILFPGDSEAEDFLAPYGLYFFE